ncbi:MAG: hypothetical protein ACKOWI_00340 [Rhodoluna sp.]
MHRSSGSAPLDFVLISAPLLMMSLAVIGVCVNGYASNVAQDVAIESAHHAALADVDLSEASAVAAENLKSALGGLFLGTVEVNKGITNQGCHAQSSVRIRTIPLGFLSSAIQIERKSSAICELQE